MEITARQISRALGFFLQQYVKMISVFAIKTADLEVETIIQQEKHCLMSLEFQISLQFSALSSATSKIIELTSTKLQTIMKWEQK